MNGEPETETAAGAETDAGAETGEPETETAAGGRAGAGDETGAGAETEVDAAEAGLCNEVHGVGSAGPSAGPNGDEAPGDVGAEAGTSDLGCGGPGCGGLASDELTTGYDPVAGAGGPAESAPAAIEPGPAGLARIEPGMATGSFGAGGSGVV